LIGAADRDPLVPMSAHLSSPALLHELDQVVGRVEHPPGSKTPALKVVRLSHDTRAGLQHPFEGGVHVVAPQAHLHGIALAGQPEPVDL
jgi:hypothetical protein